MSQPRTSGKNPLIISRPAARGRSLPSATAQETAAPWLNPPTAVFSQGIPRRSSSSSRNPQSPVSVSTKVRSSGCPTSRITYQGPPPCSGRDTWVVDLAQDRLDLLPEVLVVGRQRELLAERLERLVDREAGAQGRDLEEHTARLAE